MEQVIFNIIVYAAFIFILYRLNKQQKELDEYKDSLIRIRDFCIKTVESQRTVEVTVKQVTPEAINKILREIAEQHDMPMYKGVDLLNKLPEPAKNYFIDGLIDNGVNVNKYLDRSYLGMGYFIDQAFKWDKVHPGKSYWENLAKTN